MTNTLNLVFSNLRYVVLASLIFISMLMGLLIISEYIFLEPYVVSHIPKGTELGFTLIVILSGLSALVIPMNVYRINILKSSKKKMGGSVFGSFIGAAAGACSCGPIGFAIISTFGTIGATASAFLTNFEIPIRIAAIILLLITYFTTLRSLKIECKVNS
ncbi:hypothetical protein NsoK4_05165 [Nitrosopumilus sp. K4]|uniref:hypothetical protein n=1 Tax=Nitrosopumilus sp. K4 TaxID=2795383 RepID=UPI001BAA98C2|nr:hypothetical protein [Nitrosopumilus sp. K4]QUC63861.1 hypothetical protein NsoK4_05165 [Nitrosopumilus sp. K4]